MKPENQYVLDSRHINDLNSVKKKRKTVFFPMGNDSPISAQRVISKWIGTTGMVDLYEDEHHCITYPFTYFIVSLKRIFVWSLKISQSQLLQWLPKEILSNPKRPKHLAG